LYLRRTAWPAGNKRRGQKGQGCVVAAALVAEAQGAEPPAGALAGGAAY
jgi:hypothetical protein